MATPPPKVATIFWKKVAQVPSIFQPEHPTAYTNWGVRSIRLFKVTKKVVKRPLSGNLRPLCATLGFKLCIQIKSGKLKFQFKPPNLSLGLDIKSLSNIIPLYGTQRCCYTKLSAWCSKLHHLLPPKFSNWVFRVCQGALISKFHQFRNLTMAKKVIDNQSTSEKS